MPTPQLKALALLSKPGIKRDGSVFEGQNYTDGQWVRFQRGRPRKMGGYTQISASLAGPSRGTLTSSSNGFVNFYSGSANKLELLPIDLNGATSGVSDRTPAAFATNANNIWQFDVMYDGAGVAGVVLAHAGQNLTNIDSSTATPVYYGSLSATTALVSTGQSVSGGCCVIPPYAFVYGSDGYVGWSDENLPATYTGGSSGSARITGSKILYGTAARGGGAPAGLFWSQNALIKATFIGGAAVFRFDTVSAQSSLLSSSAIIEYDGVFFWPGIDRFMMYNGVVKEVPNEMNLNYFFDGLNWAYRQKVWATKVPRFGEIWWFYPRGTATECSHAVILNVREGYWYDVELARSAGVFSQEFRSPLWMDSATSSGLSQLWRHENGVDKVTPSATVAIPSYFCTAEVSFIDQGPTPGQGWPGVERNVRIVRVEPDFVQTGDMTVQFIGRKFPKATDEEGEVKTFSPADTKVEMRGQERLMRMKFSSNVAGGNYEMGQPMVRFEIGDERP
jgi:hypothetical protein